MRHDSNGSRDTRAFLGIALAALGVAAGCGRSGSGGSGGVTIGGNSRGIVIIDGKVVSGDVVEGSGKVVTQRVEVPGEFEAVTAEGGLEVAIVRGSESGITVETDDNLQALVRVRLDAGTLHVGTEGAWTTKFGIKVRVTAPVLTGVAAAGATTVTADRVDGAEGPAGGKARLDASGSSRLTVAEARGTALRVRAEGASTVTVGKSAVPALAIDAEGASTVGVTGTCDMADVEASGASNVRAHGLVARSAEVEASGASTVDLDASESLRADASGASTITYGGDPKLVKDESGASTVRRR